MNTENKRALHTLRNLFTKVLEHAKVNEISTVFSFLHIHIYNVGYFWFGNIQAF